MASKLVATGPVCVISAIMPNEKGAVALNEPDVVPEKARVEKGPKLAKILPVKFSVLASSPNISKNAVPLVVPPTAKVKGPATPPLMGPVKPESTTPNLKCPPLLK